MDIVNTLTASNIDKYQYYKQNITNRVYFRSADENDMICCRREIEHMLYHSPETVRLLKEIFYIKNCDDDIDMIKMMYSFLLFGRTTKERLAVAFMSVGLNFGDSRFIDVIYNLPIGNEYLKELEVYLQYLFTKNDLPFHLSPLIVDKFNDFCKYVNKEDYILSAWAGRITDSLNTAIKKYRYNDCIEDDTNENSLTNEIFIQNDEAVHYLSSEMYMYPSRYFDEM